MTSTKKIHRKLHNDKKRKKPEERDRVRMLKNDSKGHPSVARFFFVYQNRQIRCAHLLTTTQAIVNIIQLLKFFQFTKLRLMPENSVFDSDDAHQFTDNVMEDEMPPEIIKLKDPPPIAPPVVEFIEWESGIELAPIVPDFDDEAEDLDDDVDDDVRIRASDTRGGPSMMKLVMQAILARLREELTRTKRRAATPPDLTMYLQILQCI